MMIYDDRFDKLVNIHNKVPEIDMEYIYNHDKRWKHGQIETIPTTAGIIVNNVKQLEDYGYEFTIKGYEDTKWECSYGWAFIKNTSENHAKYQCYIAMKNEINKLRQYNNAAFDEIEKLI